MGEPRKVEMVRLPKDEEYFEREAVLGRDATSVFPRESAQAAAAGREAMVEALGARKFISESELATIKAARGGAVDDGSVAADKPLAAILAERKAEKDAAFQEQWKQMKTGKNRPLDPEEADFFDGLRRLQAEREARVRQEESSELQAYREAVRNAAAGGAAEAKGAVAADADATADASVSGGGDGGSGAGGAAASAVQLGRKRSGDAPPPSLATANKPLPVLKPTIKVIPKGKKEPAGRGSGGGGDRPEQEGSGRWATAAGEGGPGTKRQKTAGHEGGGGSGGNEASEGSPGGGAAGLVGLLGGYGSGSDDEDGGGGGGR